MEYIVAAESDIGIAKSVNQDSLCVKVAETELGNAALLLICDGMGGLAMGELASAEVVQSFSEWFENDFPNICATSTVRTLRGRSRNCSVLSTKNSSHTARLTA